jgi:hypothetical protein
VKNYETKFFNWNNQTNKEDHMILKSTQQDSDAGNANEYFDALRQKNYQASFNGVKNFILENKEKFKHRRIKKPLRKWQWVLAVLFPVLVVLACTKTDSTEPVGQTVSFSVPVGDGAAIKALEPIIGGLQTVIAPDRQKSGYLSYTVFIPAQSSRSSEAMINKLKGVKGIFGLSSMPVNAPVRESLLSQLGAKIFSTHIDATALSDDEVQNALMRQLKEKGFNHISVTVGRNEKGIRTIELHPGKEGPNYMIDVSVDDNGTKMVLQEEKRTTTNNVNSADEPKVDFGSMTDAQVREYIRRQYGKDLQDGNIKITRTAEEIAIDIKQSDKIEEVLRYKLK